MNTGRRSFLQGFGSTAALSVLVGAGVLKPTRALAVDFNRSAFDSKNLADALRLIGATLQGGDTDTSIRAIDHQENLARLNLSLPGFTAGIDPATLAGRVGFRPMSPDRLPIVGPVPDPAAASPNTRLHNLPRQPGLWCVQGFGARGIVWSALMADLPDLSGHEVYACGSPAMIDAALADLTAHCRLPADAFFADAFSFSTDPTPA